MGPAGDQTPRARDPRAHTKEVRHAAPSTRSRVLLVLFLAAAAHADPVVITGGSATVIGGNNPGTPSSSVGVNVTGDGFSLAGSGSLQRNPPGCLCANGQTTRFFEGFMGNNDPTGVSQMSISLDVGGVSYRWPDFYTSMFLDATTPFTTIVVPPGDPLTFTIFVPFTANGAYRVMSNATFQTVQQGAITGQGLAEVVLRRDGFTSFYVTQSVTYRFNDPAAVPEPATLVLFGLGSGGLWLVKRRGAKRQDPAPRP